MFRDSGRYSEDGDDEPEAMSDTNDTVENSDPQTEQVTTLMALEDGTGGTLMPTRTGEADIEAELQSECGWYGIEYPTAPQSELDDLAGRNVKRGAAARKRRHNGLTKSFRAAAAKRSSTRQDQHAIRLAQAAASITAALADGSIERILLVAGRYLLEATLSINRDVVLEAEEPGSAVLDGQGDKLLIHIDENLAPEDKMYSVLGYVHYHGLEYGCSDWDQFNDVDAA